MDALVAFLLMAGLVWFAGTNQARRLLPKYEKYTLWILLAAFFLLILPLRGNWNVIAKLLFVATILLLLGRVYDLKSQIFSLHTVQKVVVLYGVWTAFCLFRPETGRALNRLIPPDIYTAGLLNRVTMSDAEKMKLPCTDPARGDLQCAEYGDGYVTVTDKMRIVVDPAVVKNGVNYGVTRQYVQPSDGGTVCPSPYFTVDFNNEIWIRQMYMGGELTNPEWILRKPGQPFYTTRCTASFVFYNGNTTPVTVKFSHPLTVPKLFQCMGTGPFSASCTSRQINNLRAFNAVQGSESLSLRHDPQPGPGRYPRRSAASGSTRAKRAAGK